MKDRGVPREKQTFTWRDLVQPPYSKLDADAFTRVRALPSLAASFVTARDVRALAIDPARPSTLYAGTDGGGVFKSGDDGATWTITALGGSFAGAALVHALALDPSNPAILYAGTATGAVFKSTNGGVVWTFAGTGLPAQR